MLPEFVAPDRVLTAVIGTLRIHPEDGGGPLGAAIAGTGGRVSVLCKLAFWYSFYLFYLPVGSFCFSPTMCKDRNHLALVSSRRKEKG